MRELLLPYYNERRKNYIDTLVIHAAAQENIGDLVSVLAKRELSSHYVIGTDGDIVRLVPEKFRAWHAGAGSWRGETSDINSNSIGIELCNGLFGEEAYTEKQISALTELCLQLIDKYDFAPTQIIGHSDMAPSRKIDPGSCLPWQKLAQNGIGLWYKPQNAPLTQLPNSRQMLSYIGYNTTDTPAASAWAFCRHYNPKLYFDLGGVKGGNRGLQNQTPEDNREYYNTLCAVYTAFKTYDEQNNRFQPLSQSFFNSSQKR